MERKPVVAGAFYQIDPEAIRSFAAGFELASDSSVRAVIVPHAGWLYSGITALNTLSRFSPKKGFIILGPNHRGTGISLALSSPGEWLLPNGKVKISAEVNKFLAARVDSLRVDDSAHALEHSIEVQLPLLLELSPYPFEIVPVSVSSRSLGELNLLADSISEFMDSHSDWGLIISSDFSHYESAESAKRKDHMAIEYILEIDGDSFLRTVGDHDISICGATSIFTLLKCAANSGYEADIVEYTNSGKVTGDDAEVVAYCGVTFSQ